MRIALFTETYVPSVNGVITHVKVLKEGLERLGHEVLVIKSDADIKHHYIDEDHILHCPGHISKHFYGYPLSMPWSKERQKLIKEFNPDIVHIHTEFGIGYSGKYYAKKNKVPMVYTLHTMYDDYLYYIAPKPFIPIVKKLSRLFFGSYGKQASALTSPSKKGEEYFKSCHINKHVNIISNPVELDDFVIDKIDPRKITEIRKQFHVDEKDLLVCFCGRLGHEKSVDVLLKYWAETIHEEDHIKLMIIGGGPAEESLRQMAKDLKIDSMVSFTGKVLHDEIPPYYAASNLYVTTSLSDTNSISMLEGMALGLPVIHRKDPLNAGQVVHGKNGYIFDSAEEMAHYIKLFQAMSDEEKKNFSDQVKSSISSADAETLGNHLLSVYEEAMKNFKSK